MTRDSLTDAASPSANTTTCKGSTFFVPLLILLPNSRNLRAAVESRSRKTRCQGPPGELGNSIHYCGDPHQRSAPRAWGACLHHQSLNARTAAERYHYTVF